MTIESWKNKKQKPSKYQKNIRSELQSLCCISLQMEDLKVKPLTRSSAHARTCLTELMIVTQMTQKWKYIMVATAIYYWKQKKKPASKIRMIKNKRKIGPYNSPAWQFYESTSARLITYFGNFAFSNLFTLVAWFSVRRFSLARQDGQEEMKNKQTIM